VLAELGVTHEAIVNDVMTVIGRGPTAVTGLVPLTPRAKAVLEEAVLQALELGHNYVGTEHLLLGLFRGQEGIAKKLLEQHGATHDIVLAKVIAKLSAFQKE
jgi:ATP-dependent Clp protease ATP-binding subunit ClpC